MTQKRIFLTVLGLVTASLMGCGDNNDKRLTDADVACLKLIRAGGNCAAVGGLGGAVGAGTATVTQTSTVTVTNTTVVNK